MIRILSLFLLYYFYTPISPGTGENLSPCTKGVERRLDECPSLLVGEDENEGQINAPHCLLVRGRTKVTLLSLHDYFGHVVGRRVFFLPLTDADELPGETPYLFEFKDPTTHRVIYIDNEHLPDEIGRYINHSSIHPNCKPVVKKCPVTKDIHVVFVSTCPIVAGDQIVWDYGVQYGMEHDCVQYSAYLQYTDQRNQA